MNANQNNKILYPRGSEWRRWDLHIHSPLSELNNQYPKNTDGSAGWEQFISKLEEIKGVSVIGITDYFFIDGYKKVVEFRSRGRLKNFDLILPNVELRLDTFLVKDKSKDINFHVIFSNELKIEDIEKEFIEALSIQVSGSTSGLEGRRQLNKKSICELGKQIKEHNPEFKEASDEEIAFKNITVSLEEVQKLLKKDLFRGKFLFVLSGSEWADIDWKQAYLMKKNFLQTADILETGSLDTRKWALGKKDLSQEDFIKEFGRLKPCICGSDAHCLDKICNPESNKFCWIKAEPTFEGLKQVVYEPEERIYIGISPPKEKNDAKVIDKIEIKNSNDWFEEGPILLSENLVAIIGEKGAGKTAIADFIALAGGDFDVGGNDPASFIFKALKSSKQIENTIEESLVTIYWKDGNSDQVTITKDFRNYNNLAKVRYLSQSFIEKKCRPEAAEDLQTEIEDIIFQYIPEKERMGQTTFIDLKKRKTQSIELRKSDCKENIARLDHEISSSEEEINSLNAKEKEKSELQTEMEQLTKLKPKPSTEEEKNIEEKLELLNNRKNQLNGQIAAYKAQLTIIETIKTKVKSLKVYIERNITDIKNDLTSIGLASLHEELRFSITPVFDDTLKKREKEAEIKIQEFQGVGQKSDRLKEIDPNSLTKDYVSGLPLTEITSLMSILESKSSIAESKRKTIKSLEEKIEKYQKRVSELDKNIKEIEKVKSLLNGKIEERDKLHENYFTLLQEEKKILEELYNPLKEKLEENVGEKNQIEFFARIGLDVNSFFSKADDIIDFKRKGRYCHKKEVLLKEIKTVSEKIELGEALNISSLIGQLHKTFEEDRDTPIVINEQLLKGKKKIDFLNWIFDVSDFSVTYSIKYQGTNIELLSPGKKGIVLLLMYLVLDTESSIPLIIDQPEENLDNKSVYPYLINYFKTAKKRRQVIIITHNPNLVLNTDAEQIIVANFEAVPTTQATRIKYISGAIENSFISEKAKIPIERQGIKEHGLDVLEGGPEAFEKRGDRYEIERLKK